MKSSLCFLLLAVTLVSTNRLSAGIDPLDHVDPFIGTGGHGHTYPGATLPFGMVQLSPDTRLEGWDGCSGYHYSDERIFGFSHTHLSGTGVPDYCDVLLYPSVGSIRWKSGWKEKRGYGSRFSKTSESASPGFYGVTLEDSGIHAELTASLRAGMHRYTFPESDDAHILIDLTHRDEVLDSEIRILNHEEIEGFRSSTAWATDQRVFFCARFSKPFAPVLAVDDVELSNRDQHGPLSARGKNVKAALRFSTARNEQVLVKVGISAVSSENARQNLDAEMPDWDFDAIHTRARDAWHTALSRIEIEGGTAAERTIFYTALYHTLLQPNLFTDVNGDYRGRDGQAHMARDHTHYTVFSLWDTFRAAHPLYTLLEPARTVDFVETMLTQYREGGLLPVWELAGNETMCMIGYHSASVIADAWAKGIRSFDGEQALAAMKSSAMQDHLGLASYRRFGYIPSDRESESVSKTLEYAYDDWCIAQLAAALDHHGDEAEYLRRAQSWKNLLDPTTGFMRPKIDSRWKTPFSPTDVDFNFTEANSWQYSFFVPQDVSGLIRALGGESAFVARLDSLFTASSQTTGRQQADITGLIGQYAHGNEPSHHMAYLYAFAGQPWRTQARVHEILSTLYAAQPDGLSGNEDCGQMSAWFVLSALGFYSVTPGQDIYVVGSPLFDRAILHLENGRSFTITATSASSTATPASTTGAFASSTATSASSTETSASSTATPASATGRPSSTDSLGGVYVQSATLNGAPFDRCFLRHDEIASGGELRFVLGVEPNLGWGVGPDRSPVSRIDAAYVPVPYVAAGESPFRDGTDVVLALPWAGASSTSILAGALSTPIRFTLDGSDPGESSTTYALPIPIHETTRIRFATASPNPLTQEAIFRRIDHDRRLVSGTTASPSYPGGTPEALIDGVRGGPDFRLGAWQGFEGIDMEAIVDLGSNTSVRRLSLGCLQDHNSWIFFPTVVAFEVSTDGTSFTSAGQVECQIDPQAPGAILEELAVSTDVTARYVRVRTQSLRKCPDWHKGAGHPCWIFLDELTVE